MPPSLIQSPVLHTIPAFPPVDSCPSPGMLAIPAVSSLANYEPQGTLVGKRLNWCDMICQALAQQIDPHMVVQDLFLCMCQRFPEIREWAVGKYWEVRIVITMIPFLYILTLRVYSSRSKTVSSQLCLSKRVSSTRYFVRRMYRGKGVGGH